MMKFSQFGQKFTQKSGILQLMDDLGRALNSREPVNMLGGGNPASLPEVNQAFEIVLKNLAASGAGVENINHYAPPQGDVQLIDALVDFLNQEYGWGITHRHIALTNGSQNAFFYLFNLFSGQFDEGEKAILLPISPEYIGYADVNVKGRHFIAVPPKIDLVEHEKEAGFFKYRVDFEALERLPELKSGQIGAICCSRPTNPTGNVLTDEEMARLDKIAQDYGIPLIIDNAYGMPFPNIIYTDVSLKWHENLILCLSLSKIGLPSVRTGIVVATPQVIEAISSLNAVINLSPTRFGAAMVTPLLRDGSLKRLANEVIRPFYQSQANLAISLLKQELNNYPMRIHQPEGAIFLWIWFEGLPIASQALYERLKAAGTLIIPGEHFFVGMEIDGYPHARECIRMSIAPDEAVLRRGIAAIGQAVRELYGAA